MRARGWVAGVAVAAAIGGGLAFAEEAAQGGTLTVEQCKSSAGTPLAITGWSGVNYDDCANGGPFGVQMNGVPQGWSATGTLGPPAGVSLTNAQADRQFWAPAMADHSQPQLVSTWEARGFPYTGSTNYGGYWGYVGDSGAGTLAVSNPGSLSITASCVNFDGLWGTCAGAAWLINRLVLTASDAAVPVIVSEPAAADLLGAPRPSGWLTATDGTLSLTGRDDGTGVFELLLREGSTVHGYAADSASGSCRDVDPAWTGNQFSSLRPCKTAPTAYSAPVPLEALGDGVHTFELGLADASGNVRWSPTTYTVRVNAPGGSLADPGAPCTNGTRDDAGTCVLRAPSNTVAPALSGEAVAGGSLSVGRGTWSDATGASWSVRWELCSAAGGDCAALPGETSDTLALADAFAGFSVRAVVTASTGGGSTSATTESSDQIRLADGSLPDGGVGSSGSVRDAVVRFEEESGGSGTAVVRGRPAKPSLPVPDPLAGVDADAVNGEGATPPVHVVARRVGRSRTVAGRLTNRDGDPVRDAQIDVIVHERRAGATGVIAGAVRTNADGAFEYMLEAGPSRIVTFGYRRRLSDRRYEAVASATVALTPPVTLTASRTRLRNHQRVVFAGLVVGAPAGSTKEVVLQVRAGRRWRTFARTKLRRDATFRHAYRFTRTRTRRTYAFRASVAAEPTWPFEASSSFPVKVTVTRDPKEGKR